jgi:DNA-nicking Smr family endonuclease
MVVKEKDTIYHLFGRLPDFIKDRHIHLIPSKNQTTSEIGALPHSAADEEDGFLKAMRDVKRIDGKKARMSEQAHTKSPRLSWREHRPDMNSILEDSYVFNAVNLPEYMEGYIDGFSPVTMEKLRNGEYSIQNTLDLHGLSATEGDEVFRTFIAEAVQKQICCVKIIHGRGLKSKNGPVLKERLKEWIVRAMHRKWIVAFCSSKMADGGPGATVVLLRSRAKKNRLHIIG